MLRPAVALALALGACGEGDRAPEVRHPTTRFQEEVAPRVHPDYARPYAFSDDWFSSKIPLWRELFAEQAGQPGLHYLEIGVYEGRSFLWMLENVLTHPTSRATALDLFPSPRGRQRFLDNVALSGQGQRVTTIAGYSRVELRTLPLASFDIVYVDGSHTADDVLADAVASFDLLKTGGVVVFDDYLWTGTYYTGPERRLPEELLPGPAIDAFLATHRSYLEVVHSDYQVVLRKRENPCPNKSVCTPLGPYTYEWQEKRLYRGPERAPVELAEDERRLLEEILWSRRPAAGRPAPGGADAELPGAAALLRRLGVEDLLPAPAERATPRRARRSGPAPPPPGPAGARSGRDPAPARTP